MALPQAAFHVIFNRREDNRGKIGEPNIHMTPIVSQDSIVVGSWTYKWKILLGHDASWVTLDESLSLSVTYLNRVVLRTKGVEGTIYTVLSSLENGWYKIMNK